MGKWCPLYNKKVIYLDCQECDDRENCGRKDKHIPDFIKNASTQKDYNEERIQTLHK